MNNTNISQDLLIHQTLTEIDNWYANDYLASMAEFVYCPMCELEHKNNTECQRGE